MFPILLWGWLTSDASAAKFRRLAALLLCAYLVFFSMARAGMVSVAARHACLRFLPAPVQVAGEEWWHGLALVTIAGMLAPDTLNKRSGI